jgi:glycosyltransferase involved in cell wall biosynthesis
MNKSELKKQLSRIDPSYLELNANPYATWLDHPRLRLTIFAGSPSTIPKLLWKKEVIIVRDSWYPENVAKYVKDFIKRADYDPERIWFLSNTLEIHNARLKQGLNSHFINIGAFIEGEEFFTPSIRKCTKKYDAAMIARFIHYQSAEVKKQYLTSGIKKIALLDPIYGGLDEEMKNKYTQKKNCAYFNKRRLSPKSVAKLLRQSYCGLILSDTEGICRASSEYLLCGIPVVSTESTGGRDVWYTSYNSIIVDQNEESVVKAVKEFMKNPRDPWKIRNDYLQQAEMFKDRFCRDVLGRIFKNQKINLDPHRFLKDNPFIWWGKSLEIDSN